MAKFEGKSLSELLKTTTFEEYLIDPVTVDHDDLMKELDLL